REEIRAEMIACLALADLRPARSWEGFPAGSRLAAFDTQQAYYARSSDVEDITVRRVADDQEIARIPDSRGYPWLYFSPNGQFLAVTDLKHLRVWDLRHREWLPSTFQRPWGYSPLDFSPDGRLLAVAVPHRRLR